MNIYKYKYDLDISTAKDIQARIKKLNKEIVTRFDLSKKDSGSIGTLQISFMSISSLPEKLRTIKEVKAILANSQDKIINSWIE